MRVLIFAVVAVGAAAVLATHRGGPQCAAAEETKYVGADQCKKCHFKQFGAWKKSKMALAFALLAPTDASTPEGKAIAEKKKAAGVDPDKDHRKDAKCLPCHTTGYGKPGGYPTEVTEENAAHAAKRQGVQCEACHGPGSRYLPFLEKKENENYKRSEVVALGLVTPTREVCLGCHNTDSPFAPKEDFDFEKRKSEGTHEHVPLRVVHDG